MEEQVNMTQEEDGINWTFSIQAPEDSVDPIIYWFKAWDPFENFNVSQESSIDVIDNDGATFGDVVTPESVDAGDNLTVHIDIYDNIGMGHAELTWWLGGSDIKSIVSMNLDENWSATFSIPIDAYGTVYFTVTALDKSGNSLTSERFDVAINEYIPPEDLGPGDDDDPGVPGDDDDDDDPILPIAGEDLDHDGMDDLWEYQNGLDITLDDSMMDADNDSYTNLEEFEGGTDPADDSSSPILGGRENHQDEDENDMVLLIVAGAIALLLIIIIGISAVFIRRRSGISKEEFILEDDDDDDEVMSWD
jgi:hypothetical protein